MPCLVLFCGDASLDGELRRAVVGTAGRVVAVNVDALPQRLHQGLSAGDIAAVVLGPEHSGDVVTQLAKRFPVEERHRLVVVRNAADVGDVDVPWMVVLAKEVRGFVIRLVEDAEACTVDLLARIFAVGGDGQIIGEDKGRLMPPVARLGCVISVGSTFMLVAIDGDADIVEIRFVLPGHGPVTVQGAAEPVPSRPGVFRVKPHEPLVREVLLAFTKRRAEQS